MLALIAYYPMTANVIFDQVLKLCELKSDLLLDDEGRHRSRLTTSFASNPLHVSVHTHCTQGRPANLLYYSTTFNHHS